MNHFRKALIATIFFGSCMNGQGLSPLQWLYAAVKNSILVKAQEERREIEGIRIFLDGNRLQDHQQRSDAANTHLKCNAVQGKLSIVKAEWSNASLKIGNKIQDINGDFMVFGNKVDHWQWNAGLSKQQWLAHYKNISQLGDNHHLCTHPTSHTHTSIHKKGLGVQPQEIILLSKKMSHDERNSLTALIITTGVQGDLGAHIDEQGLKGFIKEGQLKKLFPKLERLYITRTMDAVTLYNDLVSDYKVAGLFHMTC